MLRQCHSPVTRLILDQHYYDDVGTTGDIRSFNNNPFSTACVVAKKMGGWTFKGVITLNVRSRGKRSSCLLCMRSRNIEYLRDYSIDRDKKKNSADIHVLTTFIYHLAS